MPQSKWRPGDEIPGLEFGPVTTEVLVRWAAVSGDYNRIHYDQENARAQGLPGVIMHGPFKLALLCRMLTNWIGDQGLIRRIRVRYTAMDLPGDVVRLGGTIQSVKEVEGKQVASLLLFARNGRGEQTVTADAEVEMAGEYSTKH
ncbi:MAG: dihydroxy-acid dehydratase [Chloroflexi bacterium]|nr:dihydroxy-acid dehydratase [Chloroflexota bacterium]